jgi:S1-C subfamily serine protease
MKIFAVVFSVIFAFASCIPNASAHRPRPIADQWRKAVKLFSPLKENPMVGVGATGFPVDKSNFVTAGHFCNTIDDGIIDDSMTGEIIIYYINDNGEKVKMEGARIEKFEFSDSKDLCLISRPKHGIRPVKIIKNYSSVKFGDKIYAAGAPMGIMPMVTEGIVSQANTKEMPIRVLDGKLMSSCPVASGNSGGPAFNENGFVIGVVVMVHPAYSHISFSITADVLKKFLGK